MAKVTDLNGRFVRVNGDADFIQKVIDGARPSVISGNLANPTPERVYFRSGSCGIIADFVRISPQIEFKEIYFHDGEFYDAPVVAHNIEPVRVKWSDGSIDEQEAIEWSNGDECVINRSTSNNELLSDVGIFYAETETHYWLHGIGGGDRLDKKGNLYQKGKYWLSKPETEAEKKTRELAEEVNRICCELFGAPAFDCNQDIVDTVERFIVNGYKKVD